MRVRLECFFRLTGNISLSAYDCRELLQFHLLGSYNQPFYHLMILDLPLLFFSSVSVFLFYGTASGISTRSDARACASAAGNGVGYRPGVLERPCSAGGLYSELERLIRTPKYQVEKTHDETWKPQEV